jgi:ribosomal protein L7/L12
MAKLNKDELMQAIEEMSVLELSDLVKALEEKFGVSAAATMVAAAPAGGAAGAAAGEKLLKNKQSSMLSLRAQVLRRSLLLKRFENSFQHLA